MVLRNCGVEFVEDVALVGQRDAEVAAQGAEQPFQVADVGRPVEAQFMAEDGERFGRCALAQHRAGDVARQNLGGGEDQDTDGKQSEKTEDDPTQV